MAPTEKSEERGSVTGNDKLQAEGFGQKAFGAAAEAKGLAREGSLQARFAAAKSALDEEPVLAIDPRTLAPESEGADTSMLQDTDAILSRLEIGIAKERKAMDSLLERLRQRAA